MQVVPVMFVPHPRLFYNDSEHQSLNLDVCLNAKLHKLGPLVVINAIMLTFPILISFNIF